MNTITLAQNHAGVPTGADTPEARRQQLRRASQMFVGFFMGQMLKSMRDTVQTGEFGHGGAAEKYFQAEADQEMADEAARSESYGLTDLIYRSMLQRSGMTLEDLEKDTKRVRAYEDAARWIDTNPAVAGSVTGVEI